MRPSEITPFHQTFDTDFYVGDVRDVAASLPAKSVHVVCTSPPYFSLRDYQIPPSLWGGDPACEHALGAPGPAHHPGQVPQTKWANVASVASAGNAPRGQTCTHCGGWYGVLGLEALHDCLGWAKGETCNECYLCHMRVVARSIWRVLRDDGVMFLNIADSYNAGTSAVRKASKNVSHGYWENGGTMGDQRLNVPTLQTKDRVGIPERLALALQSDGWIWRDSIHLCKTSPMPESVTDRTTQAVEMLFVFTKKPTYFWDAEAVKEPSTSTAPAGNGYRRDEQISKGGVGSDAPWQPTSTRNPRSFLLISPEPTGLHHYATFVGGRRIPQFAILAGTSEYGVCKTCGAPWERVTEATSLTTYKKILRDQGITLADMLAEAEKRGVALKGGGKGWGQTRNADGTRPHFGAATHQDIGWRPTCKHEDGIVPATVWDPFSGSGTTQVVARELGRRSLYTDLSETYAQMAIKRLEGVTPMNEQMKVVAGAHQINLWEETDGAE